VGVAKSSSKAVSDMLGIKDDYVAFCIDEAACYVYSKLVENKKPQEPKENNARNLLHKLAVKIRRKK